MKLLPNFNPYKASLMNQREFVLNVFSLFPDKSISHIQTQKLFFLIEKRLHKKCGDEVKLFNFEPYLYGPFDKNLAEHLKECAATGILSAHKINQVTYYHINPSKISDTSRFFNPQIRTYIKDGLVEFIRNICFKELCFSIYKEFPEMATHSVLIKSVKS